MKFNHVFKPAEAGDSYRIYRSDSHTVRLDFFKHIVRVAVIKDGTDLTPTFTVCPSPRVCGPEGNDKLDTTGFETVKPSLIMENEGNVLINLDDVSIGIDLKNFRMHWRNATGLLFEDREYTSYNFEGELGQGTSHYISREEGEKIYGMGDKAGHVNKAGMSFKIGAGDSMGFDARTSDPLYKQVPFYICENSVGAYGMYYDTYSNGEITFGKELNQYYDIFKGIRFNEENLVYYVILGTVSEIVERFARMCGPMLFPPKWTLKYCGSTMTYTDAEDADKQLRGFVDLCEKYGFKAGGFYLSSGYTLIGDKRFVFHWNTDRVPDPEGLSAYFKEHGVEFLPNVKPAFLTEHPFYKEIADHGWFLHYKDGSPAVFPFWGGFGSYLDFTNPGAYAFWKDCVKKQLVDKGYRNIWNDNNEYDVPDEDVYAHGFNCVPVKACDIRPLFSFLMTMASLEAQDHSTRTYSVSRCGIAGLQRFATTWTGDNRTSFEDFRYNHYMAMTMSLSGLYNFGQDIGGFAGPTPSKELFMRWIQYGLFTPRFTLHSWKPDGNPTMPWRYPDLIPQVKELFDLRESLIPYLYNEMYRSHVTYEPIIYPVFLKDSDYDRESDCFFCGDSILACPVFDEGATTVKVSLPKCAEGWYHGEEFLTGTQTFDAPVNGLPVWLAKAGSVIPREENGELVIYVYAQKEGSFSSRILNDDGISPLEGDNLKFIDVKVDCSASSVDVHIDGADVKYKVIDHMNR